VIVLTEKWRTTGREMVFFMRFASNSASQQTRESSPFASWRRRMQDWRTRGPSVWTGVVSLVTVGLVGLGYGRWQQIRYLTWEQSHPGDIRNTRLRLTSPSGLLLLSVGLAFAVILLMLIGTQILERQVKKRRLNGSPVHSGLFLAYLALGLAGAAAGLNVVAKLIDAAIWDGWSYGALLQHTGDSSMPWLLRLLLWTVVDSLVVCLGGLYMVVPLWLGLATLWHGFRELSSSKVARNHEHLPDSAQFGLALRQWPIRAALLTVSATMALCAFSFVSLGGMVVGLIIWVGSWVLSFAVFDVLKRRIGLAAMLVCLTVLFLVLALLGAFTPFGRSAACAFAMGSTLSLLSGTVFRLVTIKSQTGSEIT
jgi:MFS family permease